MTERKPALISSGRQNQVESGLPLWTSSLLGNRARSPFFTRQDFDRSWGAIVFISRFSFLL